MHEKRNADDADFQTRIYADLKKTAVFQAIHKSHKKVSGYKKYKSAWIRVAKHQRNPRSILNSLNLNLCIDKVMFL